MNETPYNPDDLSFLASRDIDGDLTSEQQKRLAEAMNASEALRADTDAMRKLDELMGRWACDRIEIDWETHAKLIDARCQSDEDAQDRPELDSLLQRWAGDTVGFDDERFTGDVMRRVGETAQTRSRRRWIARLAMPLAAAAVLAFALIGGSWINRPGDPQDVNRIAEVQPPIGAANVPVCIVTFAREPQRQTEKPHARPSSGISFTAFGLATVGVGSVPPGP